MKLSNTLLKIVVLCSLVGFGSPAWAKDCPTLKKDISQISLNDKADGLRKKPNKEGKKLPLQPSETLVIIDPSPLKDIKGECWYNVKRLDSTEYWITGADISEESLESKGHPFFSPLSKIWEGINDFEIPHLFLLLLSFTLIGLYIWWIDKRLQDLKERLKRNSTLTKNSHDKLVNELSVVKSYSDGLSRQLEKLMRTTGKIEADLINLKSIQSANQASGQYDQGWSNAPGYNDYNYAPTGGSVFPEVAVEPSPADSLSLIVNNFNKGNENHFTNDIFFFLKPTSATNLGTQGVDINASARIEFERASENKTQASYIGFQLNDQNIYLIPNLFNKRWKQVISNDENRIFEWHDSNYTLIEPAKIEDTGNGTWRLTSSGRFQ